ncbi:MAG TPA: hypothetical protein PKN69_09890, partial [Candidatus Latescibacteria bacterium]|nr:hypothetical protein [Candidatus Latescibacterota bacterium]
CAFSPRILYHARTPNSFKTPLRELFVEGLVKKSLSARCEEIHGRAPTVFWKGGTLVLPEIIEI